MKKRDPMQSDVVKAQLVRALADYDNLRKRYEEEKTSWIKFASQRVVLKVLPVVDMFEDAQKHRGDAGLAIALSELKKVLYEEGLVEIKSDTGTVFDAGLHEVVDTVEGGVKGVVESVVVTGWKFEDGPVVRPAKVKVYKGEDTQKETKVEEQN